MPKFMSSHTVPAGTLTREQINQIAQAAQNDPMVQPYRSFLNLSEGKIVCIMQAPDERALATWFQKMQMPCDSITAVELEGDLGTRQRSLRASGRLPFEPPRARPTPEVSFRRSPE
jgi:hypothetical protein